ncbi:nuclear transport factor 2 family protein [Ruegeria arenilitoris]|uniref:nuclear transport factor 2 family protein n=1 Tax=Ruegeria arenilitoris TaxID=1173585 RepID=UPI00147AF822|nr:nuclear transport factor 2 family protein [Ruegeria arenilitoris]
MTRNELEIFARMFFGKVDAQNAEDLRPYIASDIRLQMANLDPTRGADEMIVAFKATEERFRSIHHDILGVWTGDGEHGPVVSVEAIARYKIFDGRKVSLPVTSTLRLTQDGKVSDYRIFMDPGPAFA